MPHLSVISHDEKSSSMVDDLKYQGVRFELYLVWSRELLKGFDQSMSSGGGREEEREREYKDRCQRNSVSDDRPTLL